MQIKVNSEIRDIESELVFGLSVRKLVSVILIFLVVVSANIVLPRKISPDVLITRRYNRNDRVREMA